MIINENSILYFSGTGNTYDISKKVARESELKLINVADLLEEKIIEINCEVIGLAFPIYFGGIPKIISKIIDKIVSLKLKYTFALATYGGMPANPFRILENELRKKEIKLDAGFLINMPGNHITLHGARSKKTQVKSFERANKKVEKIINAITSKKVIPYEKSPYIIDRPFFKSSIKRVEQLSSYDVNFNVDSKCTKCGICERICPVKNIKIKDGIIKWDGRCEQCMACIQYCPKEAIQFGNKTLKRKRYRNPNVNYLKVLLKE